MIAKRAAVAFRAVELIDPEPQRRAECINAVRLVLIDMDSVAADWRADHHKRTKRAKLAATKLHTAIKRLRDVLQSPDLATNVSEGLLNIFPKPVIGPDWSSESRYRDFDYLFEHSELGQGETNRLLMEWLERAKWATQHTSKPTFDFEANKKLLAAKEAVELLVQFDKKISAARGSILCRVAAVLYGKPRAKMAYPCRIAVREHKRKSV